MELCAVPLPRIIFGEASGFLRKQDAQMCPCGQTKKRVELASYGNVKCCKADRDVLREMTKIDKCDHG